MFTLSRNRVFSIRIQLSKGRFAPTENNMWCCKLACKHTYLYRFSPEGAFDTLIL